MGRSDQKSIFELFKPGIVFLVLLTGLCGYALSFQYGQKFLYWHALLFIGGLAFLSGGSFVLNQAQEHKLDELMPRTAGRPIPSGKISASLAYAVAVVALVFGLVLFSAVSELSMWLGLFSVLLYNGLYTLFWKKRWAFAAVPGAIPGAMPVVIGYAANSSDIFSSECIYMFLVMFLWQMPHFWSIAIRYREDYRLGKVPTLPTVIGVERSLYHIGLYVFIYSALAMSSPWFVESRYLYLLITVPFALKVLWEFYRYFKTKGEAGWLRFFMWVNVSMLAFLIVPVLERWMPWFKGLR